MRVSVMDLMPLPVKSWLELRRVVHGVQLRAAHQQHPAVRVPRVEVPAGVARAVCRHQHVGALQERRCSRAPGVSAPATDVAPFTVEHDEPAPSPAALPLSALMAAQRGHARLDGGLVIGLRLALYYLDRPGRALRQAVAHAVAIVVADEASLAVHHRDRALVAGRGAQPAARALVLVDVYYLSYHVFTVPFCVLQFARGVHYRANGNDRCRLAAEYALPHRAEGHTADLGHLRLGLGEAALRPGHHARRS